MQAKAAHASNSDTEKPQPGIVPQHASTDAQRDIRDKIFALSYVILNLYII